MSAYLVTREGEAGHKVVSLRPEEMEQGQYQRRGPGQVEGDGGYAMELDEDHDPREDEEGSGLYGHEYWPGGVPGDVRDAPWVVYFDADSRQHYYYNPRTGVTQWEKPPAPGTGGAHGDRASKGRDRHHGGNKSTSSRGSSSVGSSANGRGNPMEDEENKGQLCDSCGVCIPKKQFRRHNISCKQAKVAT